MLKNIQLFLIFIILLACEQNSSNTDVNEQYFDKLAIRIEDQTNNNDASDLFVFLTELPDKNELLEYRIFVSPNNYNLTLAQTLDIGSDNYMFVDKKYSASSLSLSADTKTYNGLDITNFQSYKVNILYLFEDASKNTLSTASNELTLINPDKLKGLWTGSVRTSLFPFTPTSIILNIDGQSASANVYWNLLGTGTLGANLQFKIVGNTLTNMIFEEHGCVGFFSGSGNISLNGTEINSDTPGNDCDGYHSFFRMSIEKK